MEILKRATIRAMNANRPPNPAKVLPENVTACVLAGGRGMRLGQRNKGLLSWPNADSPPLIASVLQRLEGQVGEVVISANAGIVEYERFGYPVVNDPPELVNAGPLVGLVVAGEVARSDWLLSVAVDCPQLPFDLASRLIKAGADIAVAHDGKRLQQLTMLMNRQLLPGLRRYLLAGGRSVHGWLERQEYHVVDFSDQPEAFINLNTAADFRTRQ